MKKSRWSGYAKYLVLADKAGSSRLTPTYTHYLEFKRVKDVINNIAFADKTMYSYDGDIYKRKITISDAKAILANIDDCKWNNKTALMLLVANQLKIRI